MNEQAASSQRRANLPLALLLLLALAIRLVWSCSRPVDAGSLSGLPDQREYLECGRNLLRGEGLKFVDPRFAEEVVAFRAPGYPMLISLCGGTVRAIRAAQAVIDTLTVLAAYLLARRWLERREALIAAGIVALNPFLIYFTGLILSETLFTAMLAWGMTLLVMRTGRFWVLGGALLALSVLVRPGALLLPLALGFVAAFVNRGEPQAYKSWRWPLPVGTTMLLLTLLALTPWAVRNHNLLGRWIWTTTNEGFTVYDGFNADATGASDQRFVAVMPQLKAMSEVDRSEYLTEKAGDFIRMNPGQVVRLTVTKVGRTWSPAPQSEAFARPIYVAAAWLFETPVWLAVLAGLAYGTLPRAAKLFLLLPAIYLTVSAALSVGSLRYRLPAEVPMAVIAAAFFALPKHVQIAETSIQEPREPVKPQA